jgi:BolA protein
VSTTPLPREARAAVIEARLREALAPVELVLTDDSHKHRGHAGAADGRSHFSVRVVSEAFAGLRPIARHRRIYEALGTLMDTDIHALAIEALAPGEGGP